MEALHRAILENRFSLFDSRVVNDGLALPVEPCRSMQQEGVNRLPLRWGRVIRHMDRSVALNPCPDGRVEAVITDTVEGQLLIKAPYYVSRRKRHCTLSKPLTETYVQKAWFDHDGSSDAWRLVGISLGSGGTAVHHDPALQSALQSALQIERAIVRANDNQKLLTPDSSLMFDALKASVPRISDINALHIEVAVRSDEIEPDMVVVRQQWKGSIDRKQLVTGDNGEAGETGVQLYTGAVDVEAGPGIHTMLIEAIQRSTLFDTEAPVVTSLWAFPIVFR
jgi:hypothetical protein